MQYQFDIGLAAKYGVDEAIFCHNLYFWIRQNEANDKHFHDGQYWTYNSAAAFAKLYPFWSARQIQRIIKSCVDQGLLVVGNYNTKAMDRTTWYAVTKIVKCIYANGEMGDNTAAVPFTQTGECIAPNGENHYTEPCNPFTQTVSPIPDSKPNSKPDRFVKPTLAEVTEYCRERNNGIDPQRFIDHYEANGWMRGKTKIKDWQAAVRTWEQADKRYSVEDKPPQKEYEQW